MNELRNASLDSTFFRIHGCQEDPFNKPLIMGYLFLSLKFKKFQLQSKIECQIILKMP